MPGTVVDTGVNEPDTFSAVMEFMFLRQGLCEE